MTYGTITAPAAGTLLAVDTIGGNVFSRLKVSWGVEGAAVDVSETNPFPVALATVPLPTGAATEAGLGAITDAIEGATFYPATQPISGNVGITGSVAVTGTFWQATQPVSLASPVAVTGTFFQATQPVSAASLPLPAGAASESTLSTMSGKLPTLGAKASSGSVSIVPANDAAFPLAATEVHVGQVGGYALNPTATVTRPADTTAYASGDLVANSTTAGSVTVPTLTVARKAAGSIELRGVKLHKSGTVITNASFRIHFFRVAPTVTNGDNGAYLPSGVANYLGYFDVTVDQVFSDGAAGFSIPSGGRAIKLASGTDIFPLIEARGAYTPISAEVFTITPEVIQG